MLVEKEYGYFFDVVIMCGQKYLWELMVVVVNGDCVVILFVVLYLVIDCFFFVYYIDVRYVQLLIEVQDKGVEIFVWKVEFFMMRMILNKLIVVVLNFGK